MGHEIWDRRKFRSKLGNSKFILISELNASGELKAFLNKEKFYYTHSISHTTNDIEGVYQLTSASLGIGMMLDVSIQRDLDEGRLISVISESNLPRKPCTSFQRKANDRLRNNELLKSI